MRHCCICEDSNGFGHSQWFILILLWLDFEVIAVYIELLPSPHLGVEIAVVQVMYFYSSLRIFLFPCPPFLLPPSLLTLAPCLSLPPSTTLECVLEVIATAPYNPMLVFVGVPAIPALLVMLEGADLDGRWVLIFRTQMSMILFIVTEQNYIIESGT